MSRIAGPLVSAARLRDLLDRDASDLVVVDVRCNLMDPADGRARYLEGHIPGAVFADMGKDLSAKKTGTNGRHPLPSPEQMAEVFGTLGIGPDTAVVAYDDASGMFAARLWWMLRFLGHRRAALLDGGLQAWCDAGGGLREGAESRPRETFLPRPRPEMALDLGAIEAGLKSGNHLLLDAREEVRWRGETEPIDPVAGRIPGARNHPWQQNIGDGGRFLDPEALRRRFAPVIRAAGGRTIACYCGSGLTAAVNALALERAGIGPVAVYTGSWSEWCADPARPIEHG